jgi:predicted enzyme related to lactoylglutathione lyase
MDAWGVEIWQTGQMNTPGLKNHSRHTGWHQIAARASSTIREAKFVLMPALVLVLGACTATGPADDPGLSLSEAPLSGKFVWHDLMTDDPAAVKAFYSGLFGWTFEKSTDLGVRDYTLIRNQGRLLGGMVQVADPEGSDYSRWLPYLSLPDVDAAVEKTVAGGGRAVVGPADIGDIARAAAVLDPQGAVVGFVHSAHGDPDDSHTPVAGDIVWNELLAADTASAVQFYLGLARYQAAGPDSGGLQPAVLRSQDRDRFSIMLRPNEEITPQWLTHFAVADPAASARRAAALGGRVVLAPSADIREGKLALVADPTGAVLALHQWPN